MALINANFLPSCVFSYHMWIFTFLKKINVIKDYSILAQIIAAFFPETGWRPFSKLCPDLSAPYSANEH